MTSEFKPLPYWHAKPKPVDAMLVSLFVPALVWVAGFILLTGPVHVSASSLSEYEQQILGSWLMVIGGEVGTLATAAEVFRKQREGKASRLDWLGLAVSLVASLATGLSIFVKQTTETWAWVLVLRPAMPLALRTAAVLDFYSNAMELGFYLTHYGERVEAWETGRHNHLMRERARLQTAQEQRQEQVDTQQGALDTTASDDNPWQGWGKMTAKERVLLLARERSDLTQAQIAESAECSEGYVSKVLNGVR